MAERGVPAKGTTLTTSTTSGQGYFVHRCYCNGLTYEPALPFSQKSFAMQNIFGSPNNIWCPRCVFHTPKPTTKIKAPHGLFIFVYATVLWGELRVGAVLREQNALPT